MQGNDISAFVEARQGTMFEGVLANPPVTLKSRFKDALASRSDDWEKRLPLWTPSTLPLKSLSDCVNRLGIATDVYTFLGPEAVDPIEKWLIRKGISVPVYWYPDVADLAFDLTFNRSIRVVYTASHDDAMVLGMRATVVSPERAWSV